MWWSRESIAWMSDTISTCLSRIAGTSNNNLNLVTLNSTFHSCPCQFFGGKLLPFFLENSRTAGKDSRVFKWRTDVFSICMDF